VIAIMDSVNAELSNPYLGYGLDPGERGLSLSSPASMSIMRVASHEARNIAQFKNKAAQEGGVVLYTDIDLTLRKRGSYLAAVAGKSTAVILYRKDAEEARNIDGYMVSSQSQKKDISSVEGEEDEENKVNANNSEQNVEEQIKNIENKLRIENDPEKREELEQKLELYKSLKNFTNTGLSADFVSGLNINFSA
jgi:vacuolar-type H+-ATPase subunit I/STV1